jgi:hypothetical protein
VVIITIDPTPIVLEQMERCVAARGIGAGAIFFRLLPTLAGADIST